MNGDSFIKIYIKHIQNICKEKIPFRALQSASPRADRGQKNRENRLAGINQNSVPAATGTLFKEMMSEGNYTLVGSKYLNLDPLRMASTDPMVPFI